MKLSEAKKLIDKDTYSLDYKDVLNAQINGAIKRIGDMDIDKFTTTQATKLRKIMEKENLKERTIIETVRGINRLVSRFNGSQQVKNERRAPKERHVTPSTPKPSGGHPGGFEISIIRTADVAKIADAGQKSGKFYELKSAAYNGIMALTSKKKSILLRFREPMDKKQREGALTAVKGIFYQKKMSMRVLFSTAENAIIVSKKIEKETK